MVPETQAAYGRTFILMLCFQWVLPKDRRLPAVSGTTNGNLPASCMGGDFTCLGVSDSLDHYEKAMQQHFEVTLKGRLGLEKRDMREMRVLNRIVRVSEEGLAYEPDPRHCELLKRDIGFDDSTNSQMTPGVKIAYDETKHAPTESIADLINSIRFAK